MNSTCPSSARTTPTPRVPNNILTVLPEILLQMGVDVTEITREGRTITASAPQADTLAEFLQDRIHPGSYILTTTFLKKAPGRLQRYAQKTVSVRAARIPFLAWLDANGAPESINLVIQKETLKEILQ